WSSDVCSSDLLVSSPPYSFQRRQKGLGALLDEHLAHVPVRQLHSQGCVQGPHYCRCELVPGLVPVWPHEHVVEASQHPTVPRVPPGGPRDRNGMEPELGQDHRVQLALTDVDRLIAASSGMDGAHVVGAGRIPRDRHVLAVPVGTVVMVLQAPEAELQRLTMAIKVGDGQEAL